MSVDIEVGHYSSCLLELSLKLPNCVTHQLIQIINFSHDHGLKSQLALIRNIARVDIVDAGVEVLWRFAQLIVLFGATFCLRVAPTVACLACAPNVRRDPCYTDLRVLGWVARQ